LLLKAVEKYGRENFRKKETRIETEIIEIGYPDGKNIDLAIEHPVRRNGKGMICVDEL
jgi:hypothetical protein